MLRTVAVACVAGWLGIMTFFSFAVAPLVFGTIDRVVAGEVVAAVLPRYYTWGVALCAVAGTAFALLAAVRRDGRLRHLLAAALCGAMVGVLGWASVVVLPRAEGARRARDDAAFARAHRSSVQLNNLTMLAGGAVLLLTAFTPGRRGR